MAKAPREDEGSDVEVESSDERLADSTVEDIFFNEGRQPEAKPEVTEEPKVKPKRVDPTPSEEFFGESLSKLLKDVHADETDKDGEPEE